MSVAMVHCRVACSTSRANCTYLLHVFSFYNIFVKDPNFYKKMWYRAVVLYLLNFMVKNTFTFSEKCGGRQQFFKAYYVLDMSFTKTSGIDLILYCVCYIFKEGTLFCQPDSKNNQLLFMILEHIIVKVQNLIKNYSQGSPGSMMMNFWYLFSNWSRDFWM